MCFSLASSLASGAVLTAVGSAALKKNPEPSRAFLAGMPLLFGLQQFAEGAVWLALERSPYAWLEPYGMYAFLLMARVVWPAFVPFAVLRMEREERKRRQLKLLLGMGLSVSLYYSWCLLFLNVAPNINGHHVQYLSDFPEALAVPVFFIYFIASILPFFISSMRSLRLAGTLMTLAAVVTGIFYFEYLTSVWCFFAAVVSVSLWKPMTGSR